MDSFLDGITSIGICFFLGGEEAALEAIFVFIMSGGEEHLLWIESQATQYLGHSQTRIFLKLVKIYKV